MSAERHKVRDDRARELDRYAQRILVLTADARRADAEAAIHVRVALDSLRAFALRAGWIE